MDAIIIEKGAYYHDLKSFDIISGRNVRSAGEIIVPTRFLNKHKEYKTGSKLTVRGKVYKIVGEYDDYGKSFEETALIGVLADESKDSILKDADGIEAYIWYKNPRDTYTITKRIFKKFKMDYYKSLDTDIGSKLIKIVYVYQRHTCFFIIISLFYFDESCIIHEINTK